MDFIDVNTSVLPDQIFPFQVTVKLKIDNKSFEDRLLNEATCFTFYYYERNLFARLFSKSKYAFKFNDIIRISRISDASTARTFHYGELLKGYSKLFDDADDARSFASEIKKYLNEHIKNEYRYFNKLVQESTENNLEF